MTAQIKAHIRVQGARQVEQLDEAALLQAAESALRRALERTADDARSRCPVDTGELRRSIGVHIARSDKGVTGAVYASAPYAKAVELGTLKSRAQPFLYPAYRENAAQIKSALQMQLRRALKGEDEA